MGSKPSTFRQRDVTRALRAAKAAGMEVARLKIDKDGQIVLETEVHPVLDRQAESSVGALERWKAETKWDDRVRAARTASKSASRTAE